MLMEPHTVIDPYATTLPRQNWEMIVRHAERFRRAADALSTWARTAKMCVDYFEGKQWTAADLAKLEAEGRPALTINKILPLVNLVVGYHLNNPTQIKYLPGNDGTGTADIARVLSGVSAQIAEMNQLQFIDAEVFLDGLLTGRGFFDCRMDFSENMRGAVKWTALDPFTAYVDPDADKYDLNTGTHFTTSRWISVDEVEANYGVDAANLIRPLTNGMTFNQFPATVYEGHEEISPWRRFGGDVDSPNSWRLYTDQFYNWVDVYRKTIRMLDIQHYVRTNAYFFVDGKTGDKRRVPDAWGPDQVQKVLMWAQQTGEQLMVVRERTRRLRWTHMVGDVIVFDQWSPYDTFTAVPYFPYFRRGKTMGMVEPLLDSQREINVRRSARINIIGRSSNGGWIFEKGTLTAQERRNLELNGGKPGFNLEWVNEGGNRSKPEQIHPAQAPVSIEQLEKEAEGDIKEIAGINNSALGQIDQTTISGAAIRARQQQTVIGLEGTINNFHRTKRLCGRKQLEVIQEHYTEERIIRVTGPGSTPFAATINQASAAGIINDVTLGQYTVALGETTLSDSFLAAQFQELLSLRDAGIPIPSDFLIDASSLGRKEELRAAVQQAEQQQAAAGVPPAPPGGARTAGRPQAAGGPPAAPAAPAPAAAAPVGQPR